MFILEANINVIEEKISSIQIRIQKLNTDMKQALKIGGGREAAKFLLMKRKNLEKFWQSLAAQKYCLEEQLITI